MAEPPPSPPPASAPAAPLTALRPGLPIEAIPKSELMRSVGRLIRGLAALFWGLPLALVVSVQAASVSWFSLGGVLGGGAPVLAQAVLWYGLWLMSGFQKQERIWMLALDRAKLLGLVNLGLSPFLHWHQRVPDVPLFTYAVALFGVSCLIFLLNLNRVLRRLSALLPDETLRTETAVFTALNTGLLLSLPLLVGGFTALARLGQLPPSAEWAVRLIGHLQFWVLLLIGLLPIAITMSLIWKIKEALLDSVFNPPA
jgi:hypothetical protein